LKSTEDDASYQASHETQGTTECTVIGYLFH